MIECKFKILYKLMKKAFISFSSATSKEQLIKGRSDISGIKSFTNVGCWENNV